MLKNTEQGYGLMVIALHWLIAVLVLGLFFSGLYMTSLNYYDPWYTTGPYLHKAIGVITLLLLLARFAWRWPDPNPQPTATLKPWEHKSALITHAMLYLLLVIISITGYLISTADGRAIDMFSLFDIPSVLSGIDNLEDIAGEIHEISAWVLIGFVILHSGAALKHHFWDKDKTLIRMLRIIR